jgi:uncharacterized membrane protein YeaQ/YmgE (transglycosylase-associated protein family)
MMAPITAMEASGMGRLDVKAVLVYLLIGFVAGWLASLIVGGGGLIRNILIGVIGSFVGGFVFDRLGIRLGIANPLVNQIVTAAAGAIIVVMIARMLAY